MKQVSQNYRTGEIRLEEVNAPALKSGGVLVRTAYSLISAGTEGMKVREGKMSYLGKARARPDQVRKVLQAVRQQGVMATYRKVVNKLDSLTPLGYSTSGRVVAVGPGAEEFQVGQRVACGGVGYANHAEINFVPKNLVVPLPEQVSLKHAAFTTVGAVAMQGARQAEMRLGESACVVGLGLLGQLLIQILRASGVEVVGVDLIEARCRLAVKHGAKAALAPADPALMGITDRVTGGFGFDCVFIAASGASNAPTELAVELARDRARIVDIGKTRLDLPWNDCYMKELDFRFSRSYGPGRYDPAYEERGMDYPVGYVRWTERRNMSLFVDLIADGRVSVDGLITSIKGFESAEAVYQEISEGKGDGLGTVFEYNTDDETPAEVLPTTGARSAQPTDKARLALIGAGNYASSMLLPHLCRNGDAKLIAVATATSLSGRNAVLKFGFERTTTDYREVLKCQDIDAVMIATRHSSHARMVSDSIAAGKATYVEKPLALSAEEVALVREAIQESGNDRLMVGFNRRFSPMVQEIAKRFGKVTGPLVLHYRVHAGRLEQGSWYLDREEGSRFAGEAGHFFDVLSYVAGARPVSIVAKTLRPRETVPDDRENIAALVQYENGSVGSLLYLTQGGAKIPKEHFEVFGGGMSAQLNNFESLLFFERDNRSNFRASGMNKGQQAEMAAFVRAVKEGGPMPVPLEQVLDTTYLTLGAIESLQTGRSVLVSDYWNGARGVVDGEQQERQAMTVTSSIRHTDAP